MSEFISALICKLKPYAAISPCPSLCPSRLSWSTHALTGLSPNLTSCCFLCCFAPRSVRGRYKHWPPFLLRMNDSSCDTPGSGVTVKSLLILSQGAQRPSRTGQAAATKSTDESEGGRSAASLPLCSAKSTPATACSAPVSRDRGVEGVNNA